MTARWQLPIRSKTETHRVLRTKEGRVYYIPFEDADGMTGLEFFSNLATVGLWTYYLAKLVPFMNHFLPAGIFFLVVAVWQNEASSRWPLPDVGALLGCSLRLELSWIRRRPLTGG